MISRALYSLVLYLLLPLVLARLWLRGRSQPDYRQHVGERLGRYGEKPKGPVIWVHAVSVGETRAAAPLIKMLRARYPGYLILLSHMTPTGRATGEELFGSNVLRCYLPYDFPFAVRRFLTHFKPALGIFMETEIWPNLISATRKAGIPLILANARLSEKSARQYSRFPGLTRRALEGIALVAAQTPQDAERLSQLGAPATTVIGNLKYDVSPPAEFHDQASMLRHMFGPERFILLAASTRDGEETLILEAFSRNLLPGSLLVIVPRHPQRFNEVEAAIRNHGFRCQRRSPGEAIAKETMVVLGDSMGEMHAYYGACDVAFVGGSLLPYGGQNLIEACAVGKPVLFGPHTFNFADAADQAIAGGAAIRVDNATALMDIAWSLYRQPDRRSAMGQAGIDFANAHRGATERMMEYLDRWLPPSRRRMG